VSRGRPRSAGDKATSVATFAVPTAQWLEYLDTLPEGVSAAEDLRQHVAKMIRRRRGEADRTAMGDGCTAS
jgi:hypothetical protein